MADVMIHKYNIKEKGNVDPSKDPHGELVNKNVLTTLPEKVRIRRGGERKEKGRRR